MLDTSAVSAIVKGRAPGLVGRLVHRPFCLSVVTEAELRYGLARRPVSADLRALLGRCAPNWMRSADAWVRWICSSPPTRSPRVARW